MSDVNRSSSHGSGASRRWPRIGIRGVVLTIGAFALVVPLASIVALRIFDDQLIQRTEAQLIGQAVLIGEAFREAWLREKTQVSAEQARWIPPESKGKDYFPVEPILRLDQGVLPATPETTRHVSDMTGPVWQAGLSIQPILERAVRMNLSSARVLDGSGCVVSSSSGRRGGCLEGLVEVRNALAGEYAAVLRHRVNLQPTPGFDSISRRGRVRVHIGLPVFNDGVVIGVVRLVRTAIDPGKALWFDRYRLLAVLVGCAVLTAALSLFLSTTLTQPLRNITRAARAIARGEARVPLTLSRAAPHEFTSMGEALDQMIGQVTDRAEYISEFATNLSHELKTPITGIRGAAELLSQQWDSMTEQELERFLSNIEADAGRMEALVTRLLHLVRIQREPEAAEDIAIAPYCERLQAAYGNRLLVNLNEAPESIRMPLEHLESALRNLLDNAFRHGADQPVTLDVSSAIDRVIFRVIDRGPGISDGNRDRIFQRFFTTERDRGGTGLGLAIAKAVAETRGGTLRFESSAEETSFEMVL